MCRKILYYTVLLYARFFFLRNRLVVEIDLLASGEELISGIFQSALYDFNNDGFLDILLGGEEDFLLLNTGDKSFTSIDTPFGIEDVWSFTKPLNSSGPNWYLAATGSAE